MADRWPSNNNNNNNNNADGCKSIVNLDCGRTKGLVSKCVSSYKRFDGPLRMLESNMIPSHHCILSTVGLIVGIVGIVFITIVMLIIVYCCCERRAKRTRSH